MFYIYTLCDHVIICSEWNFSSIKEGLFSLTYNREKEPTFPNYSKKMLFPKVRSKVFICFSMLFLLEGKITLNVWTNHSKLKKEFFNRLVVK